MQGQKRSGKRLSDYRIELKDKVLISWLRNVEAMIQNGTEMYNFRQIQGVFKVSIGH